MKTLSIALLALVSICCIGSDGYAQSPQVKNGYVLVSPLGHSFAYLVDGNKNIVHKWACGSGPANARYLLPEGKLLSTFKVPNDTIQARGGAGGGVSLMSWEGELLWSYEISNESLLAHHDIEPLPNGNVLAIAWEARSREEAIAAGRDPDKVGDAIWSEVIVELKPVGSDDAEVVWKWSLWDHLIQSRDETKANHGNVAEHPELVDINYVNRPGNDWIHMNSIHYNAEKDLIAVSARWFDEVWIIDHSTTTEEAASHSGGKHGKGGDLVYRWGNPEAYLSGFPSDRSMYAQHDVRWIETDRPGGGDMLVFNNGDRSGERAFSSVDQFGLPMNDDGTFALPPTEPFGPSGYRWSYQDPEYFQSPRISGAERLPAGNTLICSGDQGLVFEVTPTGKRVWEMRISELPLTGFAGPLFRAPYYHASSPELARLNQ